MGCRADGQRIVGGIANDILHVVGVVVQSDSHLAPAAGSLDDTVVIRVIARLPCFVIHLKANNILTQFV